MIRKIVLVVNPLDVAALAASRRQEIGCYLKIKQMSTGTGRRGNVPARLPEAGRGAPDSTGDFDSASRGGPA